jgi:hypothetical protein
LGGGGIAAILASPTTDLGDGRAGTETTDSVPALTFFGALVGGDNLTGGIVAVSPWLARRTFPINSGDNIRE